VAARHAIIIKWSTLVPPVHNYDRSTSTRCCLCLSNVHGEATRRRGGSQRAVLLVPVQHRTKERQRADLLKEKGSYRREVRQRVEVVDGVEDGSSSCDAAAPWAHGICSRPLEPWLQSRTFSSQNKSQTHGLEIQ
jgi:hypothetical protein